ncbi:hypothetical protein GW17_00038941 [Ensete ventricosum]|nr:hypothetical protein GW17_00038941 [Ensete ventricosum]RZS21518.1 hypothetical protein BHM03_00054775 [Ensete ventricosum]
MGWLSCTERYSHYHRTPETSMGDIAAIHLEGDVIQWYNWFETHLRSLDVEVWPKSSPGIGPGLGRCSRELAESMPKAYRRNQRLAGSSPEAGQGYLKLTGSSSGACRGRSRACQDGIREFTGRRLRDSSEDRRG